MAKSSDRGTGIVAAHVLAGGGVLYVHDGTRRPARGAVVEATRLAGRGADLRFLDETEASIPSHPEAAILDVMACRSPGEAAVALLSGVMGERWQRSSYGDDLAGWMDAAAELAPTWLGRAPSLRDVAHLTPAEMISASGAVLAAGGRCPAALRQLGSLGVHLDGRGGPAPRAPADASGRHATVRQAILEHILGRLGAVADAAPGDGLRRLDPARLALGLEVAVVTVRDGHTCVPDALATMLAGLPSDGLVAAFDAMSCHASLGAASLSARCGWEVATMGCLTLMGRPDVLARALARETPDLARARRAFLRLGVVAMPDGASARLSDDGLHAAVPGPDGRTLLAFHADGSGSVVERVASLARDTRPPRKGWAAAAVRSMALGTLDIHASAPVREVAGRIAMLTRPGPDLPPPPVPDALASRLAPLRDVALAEACAFGHDPFRLHRRVTAADGNRRARRDFALTWRALAPLCLDRAVAASIDAGGRSVDAVAACLGVPPGHARRLAGRGALAKEWATAVDGIARGVPSHAFHHLASLDVNLLPARGDDLAWEAFVHCVECLSAFRRRLPRVDMGEARGWELLLASGRDWPARAAALGPDPESLGDVNDMLNGLAGFMRLASARCGMPRRVSHAPAAFAVMLGWGSLAAIRRASLRWHAHPVLAHGDGIGAEAGDGATWPRLFRGEVDLGDGWFAMALGDGRELREEGADDSDAMGVPGLDHCVSTYGTACLEGRSHILSLRRLGEPYVRVSTAELCPRGEARHKVGDARMDVVQHVSHANASPGAEASARLSALLAMLSDGRVVPDPEALAPRLDGEVIHRAVHDDDGDEDGDDDDGEDGRDALDLTGILGVWGPILPRRWRLGRVPAFLTAATRAELDGIHARGATRQSMSSSDKAPSGGTSSTGQEGSPPRPQNVVRQP